MEVGYILSPSVRGFIRGEAEEIANTDPSEILERFRAESGKALPQDVLNERERLRAVQAGADKTAGNTAATLIGQGELATMNVADLPGAGSQMHVTTASTTVPGDGGGTTVVGVTSSLPAGTTYDISWDITDKGGTDYGPATGSDTGVTFPYTMIPTCGFGTGTPTGKILVTATFMGVAVGYGSYNGAFAL